MKMMMNIRMLLIISIGLSFHATAQKKAAQTTAV
jgi:hypothetical protein